MKSKALQPAFIFISVIIGLALLFHIFNKIPFSEVVDAFSKSTPLAIALFIGTSLLIMILHTWRWSIILRKSNPRRIPLSKIFLYKIAGYGISFLTPAAKVGGEPLRAALLQKHNISFHKSLATITIDKLLDLLTSCILFIATVIFALLTFPIPPAMSILLVSLATLFAIASLLFYFQLMTEKTMFLAMFKRLGLRRWKKGKRIEEKLIEFEELLAGFYKKNPKAFWKSVIISAVAWLLMFAEYKSATMILGIQHLGIQSIFMIITVMALAYIVPIPLALGVLEAGQASLFALLSLEKAAGVGLSMLIRVRDFGWALLSIIILTALGISFKKTKKKLKREKQKRNLADVYKSSTRGS